MKKQKDTSKCNELFELAQASGLHLCMSYVADKGFFVASFTANNKVYSQTDRNLDVMVSGILDQMKSLDKE